jgi:SH3-like domain-containing protein
MDRGRCVRRPAGRFAGAPSLLSACLLAACLTVAGMLAQPSPAWAAEFRSVGSKPAILYDGPSRQASRLFVAPPGMPVEILSTLGQWVKVRDMGGDVTWIERAELVEQRMLITLSRVQVHAEPMEASPLVLVLERGVLLEPIEPEAQIELPEGWLRVRHRDGDTGFVRSASVWGR